MGMFRTAGVCAISAAVTLAVVRAHSPEAADAATQDFASTGSQMFQMGGIIGGDALRAAGPVIAGGKDALQSSGLGQMLTPDTVPPASQPDPEP
jgi:hypothetical protein